MASFSSSLIVGSVFDVLLELLVGEVGQDLLAVGADHRRRRRRPSTAVAARRRPSWRRSSRPSWPAAAFLAGGGRLGRRGLLGRRLLGGLGRGRLARRGRGHRAAGCSAATWTEMPSALRCPSSALRCRGSTRRPHWPGAPPRGSRLPVGVPRSTRATMAGCDSTSAGSILRAFEDTNTSRQRQFVGAARPGDVKSRARHSATALATPSGIARAAPIDGRSRRQRQPARLGRGLLLPSCSRAPSAATSASTTSATER